MPSEDFGSVSLRCDGGETPDRYNSDSERFEELDELTLKEYSHAAVVEVRFLTNPDVAPEELEQALEWSFQDQVKGVPVTADAEVTERSVDTEVDR